MGKDEKPIGVAVLGFGNVGSQVVRIIEESAQDLAARIGAPLVLRGIGVRRVADDRGVPIDMLTDDIDELVSRDDVDIVVELMGPVDPARKAIRSALEKGKSVVTANKALMAVSTGELAQAAGSAHVDLYFEAAVAGAIPVIRPLTQSLAGDTVSESRASSTGRRTTSSPRWTAPVPITARLWPMRARWDTPRRNPPTTPS